MTAHKQISPAVSASKTMLVRGARVSFAVASRTWLTPAVPGNLRQNGARVWEVV